MLPGLPGKEKSHLTFGSYQRYKYGLIVLSILLLGSIAAIIGLTAALLRATSSDNDVENNKNPEDIQVTGCDDIAIIGAGIAGTYAAWKLRHTNKTITVYEYSDRIGGRLYTTQIKGVPDINVELGGMRFIPSWHQLLNSTLKEVGLEVVDHTPTYTKSPCLYARGELSKTTRRDIWSIQTRFNIKPNEKISVQQLQREIFVNNTDFMTNKEEKVEYLKTSDGIHLYKQSLDSVYTKYLSTETAEYMKIIGGWQRTVGDSSCLIGFPVSGENRGSPIRIKTVKKGFSEIPKRLLEQFLKVGNRHSIIMNRDLTAIRKQSDSSYVLQFTQTTSAKGTTKTTIVSDRKCARKVVLATNRLSLENLDWSGVWNKRTRDIIINSVQDEKVAKIYLAYENPWWKLNTNKCDYVYSDTHLKELMDYGTSKENNFSVLLVGYTNSLPFWEELNSRGVPIGGSDLMSIVVTNETVSVINKILAEIFDIDIQRIPYPVGGVIGMWNSYPYGGGWQLLKPGYIYSEIERDIVKPSENDDIFIASNAFNANPWWTEGALEAVERVLRYIKH